MAVLRLAVELAVGLVRTIPLEVVHDEQVEKTVVVHINPGRTHRPHRSVLLVWTGKPCLLGDVGKRSVTVVVVKRVSVHSGNKNVLVSVVIKIADGDPSV